MKERAIKIEDYFGISGLKTSYLNGTPVGSPFTKTVVLKKIAVFFCFLN